MINFCTLFDKNYLYKAVALYDSLLKTCREFKLWMLCFDDIAYQVLKELNLENTELISLHEFEDEELTRIKSTRSRVEYYWTCTPSLPLFILKNNPAASNLVLRHTDNCHQ